MKPLSPHWKRIRERFQSAKSRLLILDFDGTLAPIRKNPDAVLPDPATAAALRLLARQRGLKIAIVSGRSLEDLGRRLPARGFILLGNHGLEAKGIRLPPAPVRRRAAAIVPRLAMLRRKLERTLGRRPGIRIEDKRLTLSIHHRNLLRNRRPFFSALISHFRKKYHREPFDWRRGKKVIEIRPRAGWHKGRAAAALVRMLRPGCTIAIGDDSSDEDMFRALERRAVTVRVGHRQRSRAAYFVPRPRDVRRILGDLCP